MATRRATMAYKIVKLEEQPEVLRRFFEEIRDEPVIVEYEGTGLCEVYPLVRLKYRAEGTLADVAGAWTGLIPLEVALEIAGEAPHPTE
jgi:hypothetical protein